MGRDIKMCQQSKLLQRKIYKYPISFPDVYYSFSDIFQKKYCFLEKACHEEKDKGFQKTALL